MIILFHHYITAQATGALMSKPDIGILNFDNTRFTISEPNEICWYKERYAFGAVSFFEESLRYRDRFFDICDALDVTPVYGMKLSVTLSGVTGQRLEVIVCPLRQEERSVLDSLSQKARDGMVVLDDIMKVREQVRIGMTLGEGFIGVDSICGVCRLLIQPDFVWIRYDLINRDFYDDFWEGALWYLRENGVILIPQRTQQKERWQYLFDDVDAFTEKGRTSFLQLFKNEVR